MLGVVAFPFSPFFPLRLEVGCDSVWMKVHVSRREIKTLRSFCASFPVLRRTKHVLEHMNCVALVIPHRS